MTQPHDDVARLSRALSRFYDNYTDRHRMNRQDSLEALGAFIAFALLMTAITESSTKRQARERFISLIANWHASMVDGALVAAEDVLNAMFTVDEPSGSPTVPRPRP